MTTATRSHRIGDTITALDMFSGVGGSSMGIHAAGADVVAAANHSEHAISVHAANFPGVEHFRADLINEEADCYIHPHNLPPARFLWASPSCKHHSPANAKKIYATGPTLFDYQDYDPAEEERYRNSERSRVTMICPYLYAERHRPDLVVVENVLEVTSWGPERDGSQFADWLKRWNNLGYEYECLFLNSGFFGCPQSRDRIYIVFWLRGNPRPNLDYRPPAWCTSDRCGGTETLAVQTWKPVKATWKLPKWGKYGPQYFYRCQECQEPVVPHREPSATAIDWGDLGPTVGERDRPLAPRTKDRIRRGYLKFRHHPLVVVAGGELVGMVVPRINGRPHDVNEQLPPVTANSNHLNLASIIVPAAGNTYERPGQVRARHVVDQMFSQTGTLEHGVASMPFLVEMRGGDSIVSGQHPATDPMRTITAGGMHHGLAVAGITKINGGPTDTAWHGVDHPLGAVTGRDTTGLISATLPLTHGNSDDRTRHILDQLGTLTSARERYLINAIPPEHEPDFDIDHVHFRMLKPDPELRRAMRFDDDYILFGNQTQMTMGLGNAVTPPVAAWITERALASLDDPQSQRRLDAA